MAVAARCHTLRHVSSKVIDSKGEQLSSLSNDIWQNPELAFKEVKAHKLLTDFLDKEGFTVERSYTGIETAFKATFGSGRPNVCVICEYDALPEIGHACGHNLIAEAGVAAGLGLKAVLESKDAPKGTVTIMGTPAEEIGGGKIKLIENGAFKDVDIAMMVHPFPCDSVQPEFICIALRTVTYTGKAAHAAAFPWEGVNALDAAVMAYTSISALRQQMKPTSRIHAIITNGGVKPNIIPELSEMEIFVRTSLKSDLVLLVQKVHHCLKGAAEATGCKHEITELSKPYYDLVTNKQLIELYRENWSALGVDAPMSAPPGGSTDMGNLSYVVPSIHPKFRMGPGDLPNAHTREFTVKANTPEAHRATLTAAKAMAHTCIDVLTDTTLLAGIREEFEASVSK